MMNLKQTVKNILLNEDVTSWFQPVIDLSSMRVSGWGALTRGPSTTPFHSSSKLYDGAEEAGVLKPLELMCVKNAVISFEQLLLGGKLFVKISHEMLFAGNVLRSQFKKLIDKSPVSASKVVIELNIKHELNDLSMLKESIQFFHDLGFQLAIDNLGSGTWSEEGWSNLNVDYVKIDRHMIKAIDVDESKQIYVKNAIAMARASGIKIIAEGVETLAELTTVRKLGITLVQGFLFQSPELSPLYPDMDKLSEQVASTELTVQGLACDLVISKESVAPSTPLSEIIKLFEFNDILESIVVLDENEIYGIVHKHDLSIIDQSLNTPIGSLVDKSYLSVDSFLPLDQVSQMLITRPKAKVGRDFIITHNEKFLGISNWVELLKQITKSNYRA